MFDFGFPWPWSSLHKLVWMKIVAAASAVYETVTGSLLHITDALAGDVSVLSVAIDPVQSGSGDPAPDNVRPISGWTEVKIWREVTHDTSANPTLTIDLDGTIYGGTLDVLTGVLTVTHEVLVADGTSVKVSPGYGAAGPNYLPKITLTRNKYKNNGSISDSLALGTSSIASQPNHFYIGNTNNVALAVYINGYKGFGDGQTYATYQELIGATNSYLQQNNITFVLALQDDYKQTVQLTPETLTLLAGENYVWCDTGDISLTYKAAEPNNKVGTAKVGTAKAV